MILRSYYRPLAANVRFSRGLMNSVKFTVRNPSGPCAKFQLTPLHTCSTTPTPPTTSRFNAWKAIKYTLAGSVVLGTGYCMYLWSEFKRTLLTRFCMTDEELEQCRNSAMMMLNAAEEASIELDEDTITDLLGEQYYVNARQRLEMLPRDQIAQIREEARRTAWEYVYGIFELETESFDLAFLECRYFLVYTPQQLELAAHSPTAKELLLDGVLLTHGEIASLAWEEGGAHKDESGALHVQGYQEPPPEKQDEEGDGFS